MRDGTYGADYSRSDVPPGLKEMFINSVDTLRHREINQSIPNTWNDRPPLFYVGTPGIRRSFSWKKERDSAKASDTQQEDPNLLKGVSNVILYQTIKMSKL